MLFFLSTDWFRKSTHVSTSLSYSYELWGVPGDGPVNCPMGIELKFAKVNWGYELLYHCIP